MFMALIKCKECGNSISDKSDKCVHCGCPIAYNMSDNQIDENLIMNYVKNGNTAAAVKYVRDTKNISVLEAKKFVDQYSGIYTPSNKQQIEIQPRCPKCGSTAGFTPMRKKWSVWNGFRTNKVEMVCKNCGAVKR